MAKHTFQLKFKTTPKGNYINSLIFTVDSISQFPFKLKDLIETLANRLSYKELYIKVVRKKEDD